MISRRTTVALAQLFRHKFVRPSYTGYRSGASPSYFAEGAALYDYLFERDYDAWLCNKGKALRGEPRVIQDFIMRLHTGETQYEATKDWTWKQRQQLGQRILHELIEDVLNDYVQNRPSYIPDAIAGDLRTLQSSVELDGYAYRGSRLIAPEMDVLDVQEEAGVLESLYTTLALGEPEIARHHLRGSEEHYIAGRWGDCIGNSRIFLEGVLREVAFAHSQRVKGVRLPEKVYNRPVDVREYLKNEGLLEPKEKETIQSV